MLALRVWFAAIAGIALGVSAVSADDTPAPGEAWKTSPFHGVTNGSGKLIPCVCRFKDTDFKLGASVCMTTHVGTVIARCDLFYNNTTWVPTGEPCTISRAPSSRSGYTAG